MQYYFIAVSQWISYMHVLTIIIIIIIIIITICKIFVCFLSLILMNTVINYFPQCNYSN